MKFLRNHWYDLGLIPLVITLVYLIINWSNIDIIQKLALINFIVILCHQFEEYRFPGGEAAITNLASQPKPEGPDDRYPLNQNNAMIINIFATYVIYLLPVIFPNILWLGFMPVIFGINQIIIHGIITPKQIGNRLYSPDFCAVCFGHVPVGLYWFYYTISNGLLGLKDVVFGFVYLFAFILIFMLKIGYGILSKPNSSYPFPPYEFERGGYAERIRTLNKK